MSTRPTAYANAFRRICGCAEARPAAAATLSKPIPRAVATRPHGAHSVAARDARHIPRPMALAHYAPMVADAATFDPSLYPRTYRMSPIWRWACLGFGAVAILLSAAGFWYGLSHPQPQTAWLLPLLCLALLPLGAYCIAAVPKYRVILQQDRLEVHGLILVRGLSRDEIAGTRWRRTTPRVLALVPRRSGQKAIKLAPSTLQTDAAFTTWFAGLPDLDARSCVDRREKSWPIQRSAARWKSVSSGLSEPASSRAGSTAQRSCWRPGLGSIRSHTAC